MRPILRRYLLLCIANIDSTICLRQTVCSLPAALSTSYIFIAICCLAPQKPRELILVSDRDSLPPTFFQWLTSSKHQMRSARLTLDLAVSFINALFHDPSPSVPHSFSCASNASDGESPQQDNVGLASDEKQPSDLLVEQCGCP